MQTCSSDMKVFWRSERSERWCRRPLQHRGRCVHGPLLSAQKCDRVETTGGKQDAVDHHHQMTIVDHEIPEVMDAPPTVVHTRTDMVPGRLVGVAPMLSSGAEQGETSIPRTGGTETRPRMRPQCRSTGTGLAPRCE